MTRASRAHAVVCVIAGFFVTGLARPAAAELPWTREDEERERPNPPPHGPTDSDAPLPPRERFAPGEPERKGEPEDVNEIPDGDQPPLVDERKRPRPDLDGREDPTTTGDVLLWVPRVILSPLYFVSEFVIRRPLGAFVTFAEEHHWPAVLIDFFTFGPEQKAGIVPTGLIDFGRRASVGAYFFWDDAAFDGHDVRVRAATGGLDWWKLETINRFELGRGHETFVRGRLSIRPDELFHGFGPETSSDEARFKRNLYEGTVGYTADLWRDSEIETFVGIRDVRFDPTTGCCEDPTLATAISSGRFPPPPGLDDGYTVLRQGIRADIDTRWERTIDFPPADVDALPPPGTGVKLELRGEHYGSLRPIEPASPEQPSWLEWVRYGATLGGYVDLTEDQRVIGLELIADFTDPLDQAAEIPFTEQVRLGGERPMRGFRDGRLTGRSAAVARFLYTWPVWVWVDGVIHYTLGNVFGEHLDGFDPALLRQSFGLGLRGRERDHAIELLVAAGTETFRDGGNLESFRLVAGAISGF